MIEYCTKYKIIELSWILMGVFDWVLKLKNLSNYRSRYLMKTKITLNTSENFKFYDYKGHRCVVVNAFNNTNSALIALATTNPGNLKDLSFKLDMVSESGCSQYVTFLLVPLDELSNNVVFLSNKEDFTKNFVSSVSTILLYFHENKIPVDVRVYSDSHTMTIHEQLIYFNQQKKLLIDNPNFNGMFTNDNFKMINLPKKNQINNYTLVASLHAYYVIQPDVLNEYANVSNRSEFLEVCEIFKLSNEWHLDQFKKNNSSVTSEETPWLPLKRFNKYGPIGFNSNQDKLDPPSS